MQIKKTTKTKELDIDLQLDADDNPEREESLASAFLEADTKDFDGIKLRPITLGTMAIMQRAKLRLLVGDTSNMLSDVAAFILIHDEDSLLARKAIYAGNGEFEELIFQFLDTLENAESKLTEFAPNITKMFEDYSRTQTQTIGAQSQGHKKKYGSRVS